MNTDKNIITQFVTVNESGTIDINEIDPAYNERRRKLARLEYVVHAKALRKLILSNKKQLMELITKNVVLKVRNAKLTVDECQEIVITCQKHVAECQEFAVECLELAEECPEAADDFQKLADGYKETAAEIEYFKAQITETKRLIAQLAEYEKK